MGKTAAIIPCNTIDDMAADDIAIIIYEEDSGYNYIAVLKDGEVTAYQIDHTIVYSQHITDLINQTRDEKLAEAAREAKEIYAEGNILYIRYKYGYCLKFIQLYPSYFEFGGLLKGVGSLNGGVHYFEENGAKGKYMLDTATNSLTPVFSLGNGNHGSGYITADGNLYSFEGDVPTLVESNVQGGGKVILDKQYKNAWSDYWTVATGDPNGINGHSRCYLNLPDAQKEWVLPRVRKWKNMWIGFGKTGHVVDMGDDYLEMYDVPNPAARESQKEVGYRIKDGAISFPNNPEIIPTDVSGLTPANTVGLIYSTDTSKSFLYNRVPMQFIKNTMLGANLGCESNPIQPFTDWKTLA